MNTTLFTELTSLSDRAETYIRTLSDIRIAVLPYKTRFNDFSRELDQAAIQIETQIKDFNSKERKFRIGIMGDVKAGKSTFLNTLLFDGLNILPYAKTPKTAALTEISYDTTNRIEVEYYSENEWRKLEDISRMGGNAPEIEAAKEILEQVSLSGLNPADFFGKKETIAETSQVEELQNLLNTYVGENGRYTPVTKVVHLYVNIPGLKDIIIVDTPGLNDPVQSRTERTREYMQYTDIVFFLSRATSFITQEETDLLLKQLPVKGVSAIVLVCSQHDAAISEEGWQTKIKTFKEFNVKEIGDRNKRAHDIFTKHADLFDENGQSERAAVMRSLTKPFIISSMAENLSRKSESEYDAVEKEVFQKLVESNPGWPDYLLTPEQLKEIGNFDIIRTKLRDVVSQKDRILTEKFNLLLPESKHHVRSILESILKYSNDRSELLSTKDSFELEKMYKASTRKVSRIKLSIETVLNDVRQLVESNANEALSRIREDVKNFSSLTEKTGTEYHEEQKVVSTAKWWNLFSWGSKAIVSYQVGTNYRFLEVSDVIENIYNYSSEVTKILEDKFNNLVDPRDIRKQIIKNAFENMPIDSEDFDANFYKLAVERTVSKIRTPEINLDVQNAADLVNANFSGQVREDDISALKIAQKKALTQIIDDIRTQLEAETVNLGNEVDSIKKQLQDDLTNDIKNEIDAITKEMINKEEEIENYKKIIALIKKLLLQV